MAIIYDINKDECNDVMLVDDLESQHWPVLYDWHYMMVYIYIKTMRWRKKWFFSTAINYKQLYFEVLVHIWPSSGMFSTELLIWYILKQWQG